MRIHPLALLSIPLLMLQSTNGFTQTTELLSIDSDGIQANDYCGIPSLSADGRIVAFHSSANNLVAGDTNNAEDVFVHDRQTGRTSRVSVHSSGAEGNGASYNPSVSPDGDFVSFFSHATNLVNNDTNGYADVFVFHRPTGITKRISVGSNGAEGNERSLNPSISSDGEFVAFISLADNLVSNDINSHPDIFLYERQSGTTTRISVDSFGYQANGPSDHCSIAADGSAIAFHSDASNLVAGDLNGSPDIFVHDRQSGETKRVSVSSTGLAGNERSRDPSISADGRYVAFYSLANNLVPWLTNWQYNIFVHDRQTGMTELVNINSHGDLAYGACYAPAISGDGRHVAFFSIASNLVPFDTNGKHDVFVHDRHYGLTERVSVSSYGLQGNELSLDPSLSHDGYYVVYHSWASNLIPNDVNGDYDVFVHNRWDGGGANSIHLTGPSTAPVLAPIDLAWQATIGGSPYWLAYSLNIDGMIHNGHQFDLGPPVVILDSGVNAANGTGSYSSAPVPAAAAGFTIYFEIAALGPGGVLFDSNALAVTFF